jgi:hypothetical protein
MEEYAASKGIQVWSADFPADDWRHVSPQRVYDLAIQRIEAKGKGILLLHDIQPRTVIALPRILQTLKARGYRIVHVVPATPERPATPTEPQQWQLHPASETVAISRWPKIPNFVFADTAALPAPALSNLDWRATASATRGIRGVPLPPQLLWPQMAQPQESAVVALAVPAASVFAIPESTRVTMLGASPARRGSQTAEASRETEVAAKPVPVRAGKSRHQARVAAARAPSRHGAHQVKHAGHAKKNARSVRVAGLKKR